MSSLFPALGASVAMAGADKLSGNRGYANLFRHLGWSKGDMQAAAAAEFIGGILMTTRTTRRVGGLLVAAASGAVLAVEIDHGDNKLAAPRALVLLAGLAAFVLPTGRR